MNAREPRQRRETKKSWRVRTGSSKKGPALVLGNFQKLFSFRVFSVVRGQHVPFSRFTKGVREDSHREPAGSACREFFPIRVIREIRGRSSRFPSQCAAPLALRDVASVPCACPGHVRARVESRLTALNYPEGYDSSHRLLQGEDDRTTKKSPVT